MTASDISGRERLRVVEVTKRFQTPEGQDVRALDGVSLDIAAGEFFVLLGPSGCGKTTLLRTLAGLEYPDAGEVWLGSERLDVLPPYRRRVNTVFQSYALFPHLTVAQNVSFGLEMEGIRRKDAAARVTEMLDLVRLSGFEQRKPAQLSGGQQQRVALARALVKQPEVLLLDEPLAALDLKLRRGMQTELKRIQRATGVTFVFVTHDQEEAMSMGDRIAVFQSGQIAQVDSPSEIYERPVSRFVADFIGETNFLQAVFVEDGNAPGYRLPTGNVLPADRVDTTGRPQEPCDTPVSLALRPEHLRLAGQDALFKGLAQEIVYVGSDVRVTVELTSGDRVVVRTPATGTIRPAPGEQVGLDVLPGSVRTVAP
ncbi:ABC transporter ATP-binding protein [Streptomyces atratus]|uniref:ABC transporter ATP-binding protein n=1 Tax=Streptomyces atratus TaxID=1893 RepID=UPI0022542620|nr:ABC transporter ATP-binding protein [Streptomyces atratus]MCX5339226.1 ABC transporter ATP-binding protein [Streptomyces atratus]